MRAARRTRPRARAVTNATGHSDGEYPSPRSTWCTSTSRQRAHTHSRCVRSPVSDRPGRSHASSGSCIHASMSASHDRRRSASNAAAPTPRPAAMLGRALLARRPGTAIRPRRVRPTCARPRPPSALRARWVSTSARDQPGSRDCAGGLLVGEVADGEEDAAGPLADRFDVGDGRAHAAQCITIGPGETVRR